LGASNKPILKIYFHPYKSNIVTMKSFTFNRFVFIAFIIVFYGCERNEKNIINQCPELIDGILIDIDGNSYKTIKIGSQLWMAENLKVTKYSNGDTLQNIIEANIWDRINFGAYCVYDNDISNVVTYGLLYNWYAINNYRNICPCGWHIPNNSDWDILFEILGGEEIAGNKMKESGNIHWLYCDTSISITEFQCGNNSSGFTALPAGIRKGEWYHPPGEPLVYDVLFELKYHYCFFWIGSDRDEQVSYNLFLGYYSDITRGTNNSKTDGYSVRCIKD
jgi:uncharacterized protein (TIGR02145 family)